MTKKLDENWESFGELASKIVDDLEKRQKAAKTKEALDNLSKLVGFDVTDDDARPC